MLELSELTFDQLRDIATIATGGYLDSKFASNVCEKECGGYGRRRMLSFDFDDVDEGTIKIFFMISSEDKQSGWNWNIWSVDSEGESKHINAINTPAVVDYCDTHCINIRNNQSSPLTTLRAKYSKQVEELMDKFPNEMDKGTYWWGVKVGLETAINVIETYHLK